MTLARTIRSIKTPKGWGGDVALIFWAVVGTVGYAWSFSVAGLGERFEETARGIGWAAGMSWMGFGGVLAAMDRSRRGIRDWFRLCLRTMGVGMGVLSLSTLANWAGGGSESWWFLAIHLGILVVADGIMCGVFVHRAKRLGVGTALAIGLWVVVLNGLFAVLLGLVLWAG